MDLFFMKAALEEAFHGFNLGEVPIGSLIVFQNKIISRAHNQVEGDCDATAHAEKLCIQRAALILNNWRLSECTLYSTVEPCLMCKGAILLCRIKRIVWGAPNLNFRKQLTQSPVNPFYPFFKSQIEVTSGFLEKEATDLLKRFFRERRSKPKKQKEERICLPQ